MKKITIQLLLLLFIAINIQCTGKTSKNKETTAKQTATADLQNEMKIASIEDGKIKYSVDRDALLEAVNKQLGNDTLKYIAADLKKGETIGDKKESYYYMQFKGNKQNLQMVRYLVKENNGFFFKSSNNDKDLYLQFYVSCYGVDDCLPTLHSSEEGLSWGCGEAMVCRPTTSENFCQKSVSILD